MSVQTCVSMPQRSVNWGIAKYLGENGDFNAADLLIGGRGFAFAINEIELDLLNRLGWQTFVMPDLLYITAFI